MSAWLILLVSAAVVAVAWKLPVADEPKGLIATLLALVLTFVFPRARVLTLPFFFMFILIALFWSARASAEREDDR
jgi:hypothetical protein